MSDMVGLLTAISTQRIQLGGLEEMKMIMMELSDEK